jgi:hypothetical protein
LSENFKNPQPRLTGFLCENGAHVFYDVSSPVRRKQQAEQQHEAQFAAVAQALASWDIAPERLRWERISTQEESKFIQLVTDMMASLRHLPPLRLSPQVGKTISYCG